MSLKPPTDTRKKALITGVTGQDGAYLSQLLLGLDYRVFGLSPRRSSDNLWRLRRLGVEVADGFRLVPGDITDAASVSAVVAETAPDEVYNLAAQSFVAASFGQPLATFNVNAVGTINLLEAVRRHAPHARFYQASTSELFGLEGQREREALSENAPFHPRSPYGIAKLAAHWAVVNYREAYGLHASCGILFNHESPLRGDEFVTQKIAKGVADISQGKTDHITLGNLDVARDWGHAEDYVRAMALMLQQDAPDDYVIATGEAYTLRDFLEQAFLAGGIQDWQNYVRQDPRFMRPADVPYLCGDPSKAKRVLGWDPAHSFETLVQQMVYSNIGNTLADKTAPLPEARHA